MFIHLEVNFKLYFKFQKITYFFDLNFNLFRSTPPGPLFVFSVELSGIFVSCSLLALLNVNPGGSNGLVFALQSCNLVATFKL